MRRVDQAALRRVVAAILLATAPIACKNERKALAGDDPISLAAADRVRATPGVPARFASIGRVASNAEISAWDIDVSPTGAGLPAGRGSYTAGATLFAQKCAACHGSRGEGLASFPTLVGTEPREGFPFGRDFKYVKTIGNYWPYSTTLYDYIRRAMPLNAPGSLRSDEVYSLVAYLLAENGIVRRDAVVDSRTLPRVRMPARDHFVVDNRTGGPVFR
jgi:S-disulfanyl-L-cysteine oxidoreductase SoxD